MGDRLCVQVDIVHQSFYVDNEAWATYVCAEIKCTHLRVRAETPHSRTLRHRQRNVTMHLHDMRLEGAAFAGGGQKVVRCGRQLIALSSQKCRSELQCHHVYIFGQAVIR